MNPELPAPQINAGANHEYQPPAEQNGGQLGTPETKGEQSHEFERSMQQIDREDSRSAMPVATPVPHAVPVPVPAAPISSDDSANPTIAADDDLIEKEWVDKAKKIISNTQNDPYLREQEVTKLQIDYLRKRYGKELGTSN